MQRWSIQFGLTVREHRDSRARLACAYEPYSLELVESGRPGADHTGYELDPGVTLDEAGRRLEREGVEYEREAQAVYLRDPDGHGVELVPHVPDDDPRPAIARSTTTLPGFHPRKLGHVVLGTTDFDATTAFFRDGLGFKASDYVKDVGAFLRCSADHHNVLVLRAPVVFPHHSSWQVDDVDEIGRGAHAMLDGHPERHVWGLGRHHAGSNFFYYLKDPSGTFSEYYSDMDCVPEDQVWTPETFQGARGLFNWGPPPPPSFLHPDDLADLMAGSHSR